MANTGLVAGLTVLAAISPLAGASAQPNGSIAPPGGPRTLYCMHVDPITGSLVETVKCWTREEWAEQGVNVDKEWAKNGVRVIG